MSSSYGENIRITIFGQSHAPAIGVTIEGLPAGFTIDRAALQAFLDRRAPGRDETSTARHEADEPEFLSGLVGDVTCGAPLTAIIRNTNTRSQDYIMELSCEESCCSAGNNQAAEQAGITQHSWQLSSR